MATLAAALIAALYLAHLALRVALAWRYVARYRAAEAQKPAAANRSEAILILQPISSGDPDLESALRENRNANQGCRFVWLVDDDDAASQDVASRLADDRVTLLVGPPPRDGENPKLVKLERGLQLAAADDVVVVLDDDTRIDGAELGRLVAALADADLVTGLPTFTAGRSFYERFIGAFVNGNAVLTYLPAAAIGAQRTLNGMIYATPAKTLQSLGGFAAVAAELTDDYAMAKLYRRAGLRILQVPAFVSVGMTIRSASHCGRVLRRWLIFANRYLRENLDGKTLTLVGLPSLLAALAPFTWLGGWRPMAIWCACLTVKAVINRGLLRRWTTLRLGLVSGLSAVLHEILVDLLLPLLYVSAFIRPRRITWRHRRIDLAGDTIRYE